MNATEMLRTHDAHDAAKMVALGFIAKKKLYTMFIDRITMDMLRETVTSSKRGTCKQLRIYVKSAMRKSWLTSGKAILEGDAEMLKVDGLNAGHAYEKLVTEKYAHTEWHKDSVPFWVDGDCEINGLKCQIKLNGGELTNEGTLLRMLEALGA